MLGTDYSRAAMLEAALRTARVTLGGRLTSAVSFGNLRGLVPERARYRPYASQWGLDGCARPHLGLSGQQNRDEVVVQWTRLFANDADSTACEFDPNEDDADPSVPDEIVDMPCFRKSSMVHDQPPLSQEWCSLALEGSSLFPELPVTQIRLETVSRKKFARTSPASEYESYLSLLRILSDRLTEDVNLLVRCVLTIRARSVGVSRALADLVGLRRLSLRVSVTPRGFELILPKKFAAEFRAELREFVWSGPCAIHGLFRTPYMQWNVACPGRSLFINMDLFSAPPSVFRNQKSPLVWRLQPTESMPLSGTAPAETPQSPEVLNAPDGSAPTEENVTESRPTIDNYVPSAVRYVLAGFQEDSTSL